MNDNQVAHLKQVRSRIGLIDYQNVALAGDGVRIQIRKARAEREPPGQQGSDGLPHYLLVMKAD